MEASHLLTFAHLVRSTPGEACSGCGAQARRFIVYTVEACRYTDEECCMVPGDTCCKMAIRGEHYEVHARDVCQGCVESLGLPDLRYCD